MVPPVSGGIAPVPLTCPACGGVLAEAPGASGPRFVCHIGHGFTAPELDRAQIVHLDTVMSVALRALNERAGLCERFEAAAHDQARHALAARWAELRREIELKAEGIRRLIEHGWGSAAPN